MNRINTLGRIALAGAAAGIIVVLLHWLAR
jgi:hypothetical protein